MCAVFGWVGDADEWRAAHRLMVELAIASEVRGRDAAGWATLNTRGQLCWRRQPGPARDLFGDETFRRAQTWRVTMAIGHTRRATAGAPAVNRNNHPHPAGDWMLVHNGVIPGHWRKADALGLRLESECDSELLVRILADYGERRGPQLCLAAGGSQSVLAINRRTRHLLAWTNGETPLAAFRVEGLGGLWWASTEEIVRAALERAGMDARFASPEPGVVYRMEVRDGAVVIESRERSA